MSLQSSKNRTLMAAILVQVQVTGGLDLVGAMTYKGERVDIQVRGVRGRRGSRSEVVVGQRMPKRCVAAGCSNVSNLKEGISLHKLPFYDDDRPEAKKRRQKWVDFVRLKRMKW